MMALLFCLHNGLWLFFFFFSVCSVMDGYSTVFVIFYYVQVLCKIKNF